MCHGLFLLLFQSCVEQIFVAGGYNSVIRMPSGGITVDKGTKCLFAPLTVFPAAVFTAHYARFFRMV